MTVMFRAIAIAGVLAFFTMTPARAQTHDIAGSKDHPLISRYPGSVIQSYDQKEYEEFELPLSKPKDIHGLDKSLHLEGKLTHIRYKNPPNRSTLEIYRNYETGLTNAGFVSLFKCKGREGPEACGLMEHLLFADWGFAGDYEQQRYLSAKLARPEGDVYVSILVAVNMVQLVVVEVKPMETGLVTVNAASLAGDITRTGHVAVYGIYFDSGKADVKPESDAALKEIAKLLQQDAKLKLYVVGHTDNQGTLDMNMGLSMHRADAVVQALSSKFGVAAARLKALGDGPSAPVASNDTEEGRAKNRRVELVKQ